MTDLSRDIGGLEARMESSLTGGGSTVVPVFCNGTSWTAH